MKTGHIAALAAAAFFIEPSVAGLISFSGKAPELLLCLMIAAVFSCRDTGLVVGMIAAFAALQEICFSLYAGPGAFAVFLAGTLAAAAARYCTWDRLPFYLAFTVFDTAVYELILWAGLRILGGYVSFTYFLKLLPLSACYNVAIMLPMYYWLLKQKQGAEEI
ncbi:MAG: hypothetical protein HFE76_15490 [Firmicutes bacterium]|nr:hypothetical protein [Bacillota bacterium]